ncbi:hypothetical protein ABIB44_000320 [Hymenobacter sp. UYCo722]
MLRQAQHDVLINFGDFINNFSINAGYFSIDSKFGNSV